MSDHAGYTTSSAMRIDASGSTQYQPYIRINDAGGDCLNTSERVGEYVQPCAANIQVVRMASAQQPQAGEIHREASRRDTEHQAAFDLGRLLQSLVGFHEDEKWQSRSA